MHAELAPTTRGSVAVDRSGTEIEMLILGCEFTIRRRTALFAYLRLTQVGTEGRGVVREVMIVATLPPIYSEERSAPGQRVKELKLAHGGGSASLDGFEVDFECAWYLFA